MQQESGVSFMQMRREMGGTAEDFKLGKAGGGALYRDPREQIAAIRSLSQKEMNTALNENSLAKQAQQLEKITKAFTGMRAAISAVQATSAAWKGDWDGVQEAVNQLPFGIGQMAAAVADLKAEWTGAKAEVEKYTEEAKRLDKEAAFGRNVADVTKDAKAAAAERIAEIGRERRGIGLTGLDKEIYGIRSGAEGRIASLQKAKDEAIQRAGVDVTSKQAKDIAAEFDKQIAAEKSLANEQMAQAEKDFHATRLAEEQRAEADRLKEVERAGKERVQAEADAARDAIQTVIDRDRDQMDVLKQRISDEQQSFGRQGDNQMITATSAPGVALSGRAQREEAFEKQQAERLKRIADLNEQIEQNTRNMRGQPVALN